MQSNTDDMSLQSFYDNIKYTPPDEDLLREQRVERFRAATKSLDAAGLEEIFKWYYAQTESVVILLEQLFSQNADRNMITESLLLAYKCCDLLRFHVECCAARFVHPDQDVPPLALQHMYLTLYKWQSMSARCDVLCQRQRAVEQQLHRFGIVLDNRIVNAMSQHRPLIRT